MGANQSNFCTSNNTDETYVSNATSGHYITNNEKSIIRETWQRNLPKRSQLFSDVLWCVVGRSPTIKEIFKLRDISEETRATDERYQRICRNLGNFFSQLIDDLELKEDKIKEACRAMGARHKVFHSRGFNYVYWDIFIVSICEVLETSFLGENDMKYKAIYVWQKFVRYIVDRMREGYFVASASGAPPGANPQNVTTPYEIALPPQIEVVLASSVAELSASS